MNTVGESGFAPFDRLRASGKYRRIKRTPAHAEPFGSAQDALVEARAGVSPAGSELGRIETDLDDPELIRVLSRIHTWPVTLEICRAIRGLDFRSDPADEIVAATSVAHRVPLVTRDAVIRRSHLVPIAR